MNRTTKISFLLMFVVCLAGACTNSGYKPGQDAAADSILKSNRFYYSCTMDPSVVSDKHGICPKCGMDLVEVENKNFKKGK